MANDRSAGSSQFMVNDRSGDIETRKQDKGTKEDKKEDTGAEDHLFHGSA